MYVVLYCAYLVFSLNLVFARIAADFPLFSLSAVGLYGLSFLMLGIFAVIWQQVLKRLPLTTAYANRATTIPYGILWSVTIFAEDITWNMVVGSIIIIAGAVTTSIGVRRG